MCVFLVASLVWVAARGLLDLSMVREWSMVCGFIGLPGPLPIGVVNYCVIWFYSQSFLRADSCWLGGMVCRGRAGVREHG